MNAPDKIYMPNELLSEEWTRHVEGQDTAYIRLESLWHKPSEKPQERCIVIDAKHETYDHFISVGVVEYDGDDWHFRNSEITFKPADIKLWAYATDLLPKGKED